LGGGGGGRGFSTLWIQPNCKRVVKARQAELYSNYNLLTSSEPLPKERTSEPSDSDSRLTLKSSALRMLPPIANSFAELFFRFRFRILTSYASGSHFRPSYGSGFQKNLEKILPFYISFFYKKTIDKFRQIKCE
jgi:hypothetical protein